MPVLVRNREGGPAVFGDLTENIQIEWGGSGDPEGKDVQYVPDRLMESVSFISAISKGIFEVVDPSPEVQAMLDRQSKAYQQRREAARQATDQSIDHQSERTLTTAVISETGKVVDGKAEESTTPVVVGTREYGPK